MYKHINEEIHTHTHIYIYTHIFFFHHTTCESTCDTLASSAANQGDNTVLVAQGSTVTPGAVYVYHYYQDKSIDKIHHKFISPAS